MTILPFFEAVCLTYQVPKLTSSEEDSEPLGLIGECILAVILLLERQPKLPTVGTQPLR